MQLYLWSASELFYLFTTAYLVTTNDERKFFRQRVLFSLLRTLHGKFYFRQYAQLIQERKQIDQWLGNNSVADSDFL
jgi:hypothetical protein